MARYFSLIISIIPILAWSSQYSKIITLSYDIDEFQFYENRDITSINSIEFDMYFDSNHNMPALPGIPFSVLIGANEQFIDFSYTSDNDTILNNINISACYEPQPTQTPLNPVIPVPVFNSIYNAKIEYKGCHKNEHYNVLYFIAYPFAYNGIRKKLTLNQTYTLSITLIQDNNYQAPVIIQPNSIVSCNNIRHHIEQTAINGNELDQYYPLSIYPTSGEQHADYEYIIVAPSWAESYFQPLIDWKTQKGIKAKVLTLNYIQNNYPGNTTQIKIKNALRDYYDGQYSGLKYVMLAGTDYLIPSQECIIELHNSSRDTIGYTPCDLFYAAFETMDWDKNGNGIYGEREDSINLYPNINVTRIPINSGTDAAVFVNRILEYEKNPNTANWENKMLTCGNIIADSVFCDGRFNSDAYKAGKDIYELMSKYWNGNRIRFYDTFTDFPGGEDYDFTSANLQSELEKGYKFVQVDTHGYPTYWLMETTDEHSPYNIYDTNKASSLSNSSYSIITTSACHTNDFSYSFPCLSRRFMFNPNSGIIAYLGTSTTNWWGCATYYNKNFYRYLCDLVDMRFSSAVTRTKAQFINLGWCDSTYNCYRWILFALNPIGDPEMPIYTSRPKQFEQLYLNYCNNRLSIDTKIESCRICLMSINDNGNSYYRVYDNVQCAEFDDIINCDSLSLCITKPGYIPFVRTVTKTTYIQNETINEDRHIVSEETYIGYNVTTEKAEGPVVIESSTTDICIGDGTLIKNDFEVKKGVTFEIK